jgi:REP element-mobilizing transposase RayT
MKMARLLRRDGGDWQHVSNHAVDGIAAFENEVDVRCFLALVAREVRRGRLRVYAFVILSTHFHLLASSPTGELSRAMQRIESEFAQSYNRRRNRQGHVFKGRFWSKPVKTLAYRRFLVRYIDANAVKAGLAATSVEYPFGSARCYATGAAPKWLDRTWIEAEAVEITSARSYRPELYTRAFGMGTNDDDAEQFVQRRSCCPTSEPDRLDEFVAAGAERVRDWLRERADLRPRTLACMAVASVRGIERAVAASADSMVFIDDACGAGRKPDVIVRIALLRDLGGFDFAAIGRLLGMPRTTVQDTYAGHARAMRTDDRHALAVATIGHAAIVFTLSPSSGA